MNDPERNFISARPEGGSWSTLGTIPLPLTDGVSSSGRFRYGDITLAVPVPAALPNTAVLDTARAEAEHWKAEAERWKSTAAQWQQTAGANAAYVTRAETCEADARTAWAAADTCQAQLRTARATAAPVCPSQPHRIIVEESCREKRRYELENYGYSSRLCLD